MKVTKLHIWIVVIVLVVIIVISIHFYRKGKRQVTIQALPGDLPGSTDSNNNPAGVSNSEISSIVNALHDDMDGLAWYVGSHSASPYYRALLLSDTDLVKVYNAFNSLYQSDSEQTLTEWIKSEKYSWFTNAGSYAGSLLDRMAKLNLK